MEGGKDPWNRRTFPWDSMDEELLAHFRLLCQLRRTCEPLRTGELGWGPCHGHVLTFYRTSGNRTVCTVINAGPRPERVTVPWSAPSASDLLTGRTLPQLNGPIVLDLPAFGGSILSV